MFGAERRGAAALRGALQEGRARRARQLPPVDARERRHARSARWRSSAPTPPSRARTCCRSWRSRCATCSPAATEVDRRDFLARADLLAACGMTVLISDYFEYYRLAAYLAWRTKERIGIVMGAPSLIELFDEKYYTQLPGGILESLRPAVQERPQALRLSAARPRRPASCTTVENLAGRARAAEALRLPRRPRQLRAARQLQPRIPPHLLARRAQAHRRRRRHVGDDGPAEVAELIKKRRFFGYAKRPRRTRAAAQRNARRWWSWVGQRCAGSADRTSEPARSPGAGLACAIYSPAQRCPTPRATVAAYGVAATWRRPHYAGRHGARLVLGGVGWSPASEYFHTASLRM